MKLVHHRKLDTGGYQRFTYYTLVTGLDIDPGNGSEAKEMFNYVKSIVSFRASIPGVYMVTVSGIADVSDSESGAYIFVSHGTDIEYAHTRTSCMYDGSTTKWPVKMITMVETTQPNTPIKIRASVTTGTLNIQELSMNVISLV